MFANEKVFGVALMKKCKAKGLDTMRIESASTISGCPDLWVQGKGDDWFIELKNDQTLDIDKISQVRVRWRPGQQAWAARYSLSHTRPVEKSIQHKYSWTALGAKNGVIFIRMQQVFYKDTVSMQHPAVYIFTDKEFRQMDIAEFLKYNSYMLEINKQYDTWQDLILYHFKEYIDIYCPGIYDTMDIPATSDIYGLLEIPWAIDDIPNKKIYDIVKSRFERNLSELSASIIGSWLLNNQLN